MLFAEAFGVKKLFKVPYVAHCNTCTYWRRLRSFVVIRVRFLRIALAPHFINDALVRAWFRSVKIFIGTNEIVSLEITAPRLPCLCMSRSNSLSHSANKSRVIHPLALCL